MTTLSEKRILLIISGGIAAYKSLEAIRRLRQAGARVRCVLTDGGAQFITPLAVSALSGEPAHTSLFDCGDESRMGHIRLSREADLILVAPASANMIAKMAHGMADSLAAAVLLAASDKPLLIAPAMNSRMWAHPATQENVAKLRARGVKIVGPACGALACGEDGDGRMSEPGEILEAVERFFAANRPLAGRKALVTSGPTFEPLDPVRFIGNRSSGKQGQAVAVALAALGAEVTLVTGPTALSAPPGVKVVRIETARDMLAACQAALPCEIAVCAAAVADWRPETIAADKIKKSAGAAPPSVALTENPDILAALSRPGSARPRLVVGFAAETGDLLQKAQDKFLRKGCDWLLANDVAEGKIFGHDENEVTLFRKDPLGNVTATPWPRAGKQAIAQRLAAEMAEEIHA